MSGRLRRRPGHLLGNCVTCRITLRPQPDQVGPQGLGEEPAIRSPFIVGSQAVEGDVLRLGHRLLDPAQGAIGDWEQAVVPFLHPTRELVRGHRCELGRGRGRRDLDRGLRSRAARLERGSRRLVAQPRPHATQQTGHRDRRRSTASRWLNVGRLSASGSGSTPSSAVGAPAQAAKIPRFGLGACSGSASRCLIRSTSAATSSASGSRSARSRWPLWMIRTVSPGCQVPRGGGASGS